MGSVGGDAGTPHEEANWRRIPIYVLLAFKAVTSGRDYTQTTFRDPKYSHLSYKVFAIQHALRCRCLEYYERCQAQGLVAGDEVSLAGMYCSLSPGVNVPAAAAASFPAPAAAAASHPAPPMPPGIPSAAAQGSWPAAAYAPAGAHGVHVLPPMHFPAAQEGIQGAAAALYPGAGPGAPAVPPQAAAAAANPAAAGGRYYSQYYPTQHYIDKPVFALRAENQAKMDCVSDLAAVGDRKLTIENLKKLAKKYGVGIEGKVLNKATKDGFKEAVREEIISCVQQGVQPKGTKRRSRARSGSLDTSEHRSASPAVDDVPSSSDEEEDAADLEDHGPTVTRVESFVRFAAIMLDEKHFEATAATELLPGWIGLDAKQTYDNHPAFATGFKTYKDTAYDGGGNTSVPRAFIEKFPKFSSKGTDIKQWRVRDKDTQASLFKLWSQKMRLLGVCRDNCKRSGQHEGSFEDFWDFASQKPDPKTPRDPYVWILHLLCMERNCEELTQIASAALPEGAISESRKSHDAAESESGQSDEPLHGEEETETNSEDIDKCKASSRPRSSSTSSGASSRTASVRERPRSSSTSSGASSRTASVRERKKMPRSISSAAAAAAAQASNGAEIAASIQDAVAFIKGRAHDQGAGGADTGEQKLKAAQDKYDFAFRAHLTARAAAKECPDDEKLAGRVAKTSSWLDVAEKALDALMGGQDGAEYSA